MNQNTQTGHISWSPDYDSSKPKALTIDELRLVRPLGAAHCSAFELRGTSIHDAKTKKLICTIWPDRKASEERLEGESWLAMRERTDPERDAIQRHTEERAVAVCAFLNSQNAEGDSQSPDQ